MVAKLIHQRFTQPFMEKFAAESLKLHPGEIECLQLASVGLTTDEMAKATGYQANTINIYLEWAAKKLGAKNRSQAVAEALRRGLIE